MRYELSTSNSIILFEENKVHNLSEMGLKWSLIMMSPKRPFITFTFKLYAYDANRDLPGVKKNLI